MPGKLPSAFPACQWKGLRPSSAGSTGLIPDQGNGVPQAMQQKNSSQTNKPLPRTNWFENWFEKGNNVLKQRVSKL